MLDGEMWNQETGRQGKRIKDKGKVMNDELWIRNRNQEPGKKFPSQFCLNGCH
jgi:hypothetical protein